MIYLAQLLCPARHCPVALLGERDGADNPAWIAFVLKQQIDTFIGQGMMFPVCNLCGSSEFSLEAGTVNFASLEEAHPHSCEAGILQDSKVYFTMSGNGPTLKAHQKAKLN